METQIFQNAENIITFQKSSKRNQNPSRYYYNLIINLKFQHKPKYLLSKILKKRKKEKKKIYYYYYLGAYKNPLSYYTL